MENLVQLEGLVQDTFIQRQHLIAVFFDLEKAYDTTWKYGILRTMHGWGFRGHLPLFIQNFMADRTFHVRVGNTMSPSYAQENGVPQGAVLSVTLFTLHVMVQSVAIPVVYALMERRTAAAYEQLLRFVIANLAAPGMTPTVIVTDFEAALQRAMENVFPASPTIACWFHYIQASEDAAGLTASASSADASGPRCCGNVAGWPRPD